MADRRSLWAATVGLGEERRSDRTEGRYAQWREPLDHDRRARESRHIGGDASTMSDKSLPDELSETMEKAILLEYWNIFWTVTVIVTMGLVLGQSQTMKTAWIEDAL